MPGHLGFKTCMTCTTASICWLKLLQPHLLGLPSSLDKTKRHSLVRDGKTDRKLYHPDPAWFRPWTILLFILVLTQCLAWAFLCEVCFLSFSLLLCSSHDCSGCLLATGFYYVVLEYSVVYYIIYEHLPLHETASEQLTVAWTCVRTDSKIKQMQVGGSSWFISKRGQ